LKEAKYYKSLENGYCECLLCPHHCKIAPNKAGLCRARKNIDGKLYAINYGRTTSIAVDPIEKKPLYHFHPGSDILSIAPNSCNLFCPYCQNAEISQMEAPTEFISPEDLVNIAKRYNSIGVAYTYSEPLTWFEYLLDAGEAIHRAGLVNVLVTNGMLNPEPLFELIPIIDAANIDLKSIRKDFYKNLIKGDLDTVLNFIRTVKKHWHIELTNLVIPGYNDTDEDFKKLVDFVCSIGDETPLHFSRFFPHYKMQDVPPTPVDTLLRAYRIAKEKLKYVYIGNVLLEEGNNTYCPYCGNLLVERYYFHARVVGIKDKKCTKCNNPVDFVL